MVKALNLNFINGLAPVINDTVYRIYKELDAARNTSSKKNLLTVMTSAFSRDYLISV